MDREYVGSSDPKIKSKEEVCGCGGEHASEEDADDGIRWRQIIP